MRVVFFDIEQNVLDWVVSGINHGPVLLFNGNSFNKKIFKMFKNKSAYFINNSGHNAEPPDFYSEDLSIMFDVARINDSEIKKSYNPTFIAENKMKREVEESWLGSAIPNIGDKLICTDANWGSDAVHSIYRYKKNMMRVIKDHLSSSKHTNKIQELWVKNHPAIKYKGLLIFDETENYFKGTCLWYPPLGQWMLLTDEFLTPYAPWMDKNIIDPIYQSDCDFLIWAMPYKKNGELTRYNRPDFPYAVILDTRYSRNTYIEYDYASFART